MVCICFAWNKVNGHIFVQLLYSCSFIQSFRSGTASDPFRLAVVHFVFAPTVKTDGKKAFMHILPCSIHTLFFCLCSSLSLSITLPLFPSFHLTSLSAFPSYHSFHLALSPSSSLFPCEWMSLLNKFEVRKKHNMYLNWEISIQLASKMNDMPFYGPKSFLSFFVLLLLCLFLGIMSFFVNILTVR